MTKTITTTAQASQAMEAAQVKTITDSNVSKSQKIIGMYGLGMSIKDIAVAMGIRYNFAYNVISNYTRVNALVMPTANNGPTKKQQVIDLVKTGASNTEISKALSTNYNYVYKIAREYTDNGGTVTMKEVG